MRILYLGLDPTRYPRKVFHYPVIRTVLRENLDVSKASIATHFLFTSRSAVHYWTARYEVFGQALAIGDATAAALMEKGIEACVAETATQEGVVDLLERLPIGFLFWPRSALARGVIEEYLTKKGVPFFVLDLYETKCQKTLPVPDLKDFDEIVFTSPSTVAAFLQVFGPLPQDIKLTALGPVTEAAIQEVSN